MNKPQTNPDDISFSIQNRSFFKWSAVASMSAGFLYLLIQLIHPTDALASVTTTGWLTVHVVSLVMDFLALIALNGILLRQYKNFRWYGFLGYFLFSVFFVMSFAFHFIEGFVYPILVNSSPAFVEGLLGLIASKPSSVDLGLIPTVYAMTGISYLLGGFILGLSLYRSEVFSKTSSLLLSFGSLVTILGAFIPHPLDRTMAIPVGLALICLGREMFSLNAKAN